MNTYTIEFPQGILGFEKYHSYLPIPLCDEGDGLIELQSTENEGLAFIIMNPFHLLPEYNPKLSARDYANLQTDEEEDLSYYVICVVKDPFGLSTVNMKCPIVVNVKKGLAYQVILEEKELKIRTTLNEFMKKGEAHVSLA